MQDSTQRSGIRYQLSLKLVAMRSLCVSNMREQVL